MTITPGWRLLAVGLASEPVLVEGVDLWTRTWSSCRETIVVAHPSYPAERHTLSVYRLADVPDLRFAAGEFSNGVWGFFVPDPG
ncbi:MAG TPA: hypothetical protein VLT59_08935 [Steroidobacteraceae bacterium]|nr:hypothetical protein [Steroidobacteraceae bacterium]